MDNGGYKSQPEEGPRSRKLDNINKINEGGNNQNAKLLASREG